MEKAAHGNLLEYIKLRVSIPVKQSRKFFNNLLDGVEYMHSNKVVHR